MDCTTGAWGSDFRQKQEIYFSVLHWGPRSLLHGRQGCNCGLLHLGPVLSPAIRPCTAVLKILTFLSLIILKIRNM